MFFILLFVAGVALQVLTFRKERAVKPRRIVIGQAAAFGSMVAFSIITLRPPGLGAWVVLLAVGIGGGIVYSRFVNVRTGDKGVTMSYTLPWLITWGTLMVITQLTSVFAQSVPVIIYGLAIVNLGINLGLNGRILGTYRSFSAGAVAAVLGIGVVGLTALGPTLPASAQTPAPTQDLPPEVESAIVSDGGTLNIGALYDSDGWIGPSGDLITGPEIDYIYSLQPFVTSWYSESEQEWRPHEIYEVFVHVYWFNDASDAVRAYEHLVTSNDGMARDLGFGFPTAALDDMGSISLLPEFAVQKGSLVVKWSPFGSPEHNPNSPGNLAGTEQLAAVLASVQEIDVDAIRAGWYGTTSETPPTQTDQASEPDTDRSLGNTSEEQEPLDPAQSAVATAVAGIILAGGSLLQLTDRFDPALIIEELNRLRGQIPEPALNDNGLVLTRMPWDEGGPTWVSKEDAQHAADMQARGYAWDKRWGWVHGDEAATRQGNVDSGRDQWLARDPVADKIVSDIMASRSDLAHQLAAMDRADKMDAIADLESQAWIDSRMAGVADNRYFLVSGVSVAADVAFGLATGGLASVRPIGQLAIRAGMHMTVGQAQGWSENKVEGREWDGEAFVRGVSIGVVRTATDFGAEGAIAAVGKVVPIARATWSGVRGAGELPENLIQAKQLLNEAAGAAERVAATEGLEAGLKTVDRDAALDLLREGNRLKANGSSLADLEAAGQVTSTQARLVRQVWTETFDDSAEIGAKKVFDTFEQQYGSGLKEVLLGDQGSSARRFAVGSLKTDADRTVLPVFEHELLERITSETGETLEQVNMRLTDEVTEMWRTSTAQNLQTKNLIPADFDAASYSGFGRSTTADDAYDASWVMQRQEVGTTMVVRPGDAPTYRAGGGAIVDQAKLNTHLTQTADATMDAARVNTDSALTLVADQAEVVAGATDVKTAAKGFARQAWAAARHDISGMAAVTPDQGLRRLADALVAEPQDQMRLLQEAGYTAESFLQAMQTESARLMDALGQ